MMMIDNDEKHSREGRGGGGVNYGYNKILRGNKFYNNKVSIMKNSQNNLF